MHRARDQREQLWIIDGEDVVERERRRESEIVGELREELRVGL